MSPTVDPPYKNRRRLRTKKHRGRRLSYRYRPQLEALEDRMAPAYLGLGVLGHVDLYGAAAQVSLLQNQPPFAANFEVETLENQRIHFFLHADDGDPDKVQALTFTLRNQPLNGQILAFDPSTGEIVYQPDSAFSGADTFSYSLEDSEGAVSLEDTVVTISVTPQADPPKITVHNAAGVEAAPIALDITASLRDTDGSESLSFAIGLVPPGATFSAGTNLGNGNWTFTQEEMSNLSVTLPQDGAYVLLVAAISTEGANGDQKSVTRPLTVTVGNIPPVLTAPDSVVLEAGLPLNVLIGLTDQAPDELTLTVDFGDGTAPTTYVAQSGFVTLDHVFELPDGVQEKDFFVHLDASDGSAHVFDTMVVHVFSSKQIDNLDEFATVLSDGVNPAEVGVEWSNNAALDATLIAPAGWSLFVAGYKANPTEGDNAPNEQGQSFVTTTDENGKTTKQLAVGFFDVRATGDVTDQGVVAVVSVSFLVPAGQADLAKLFAWDGDTWREASSANPILSEISGPDAAGMIRVTLTYTFTADTFPAVHSLGQTIFTMAVNAPPAPPQTASISQPAAVASLNGVPPTTVQTTFTSTNQLSLVLQVSRTEFSSNRTEASVSTTIGDGGGGEFAVNIEQFEDLSWMFHDWTPPRPAAPDAAVNAPMVQPRAEQAPAPEARIDERLPEALFVVDGRSADASIDVLGDLDATTAIAAPADARLAFGGAILGLALGGMKPPDAKKKRKGAALAK